MKQILGAVFAAVVLTAPAFAADLPARTYTKAPALAPVAYSWTGCYIGGNVGGGFRASTSQTRTGQQTLYCAAGQLWFKLFTTVVGIQGMYDYARVDSSHIIPAFPTFSRTFTSRTCGPSQVVLGYLFTPQLLGYVKGGGTWTSVDYVINGNGPPAFNSENAFWRQPLRLDRRRRPRMDVRSRLVGVRRIQLHGFRHQGPLSTPSGPDRLQVPAPTSFAASSKSSSSWSA